MVIKSVLGSIYALYDFHYGTDDHKPYAIYHILTMVHNVTYGFVWKWGTH